MNARLTRRQFVRGLAAAGGAAVAGVTIASCADPVAAPASTGGVIEPGTSAPPSGSTESSPPGSTDGSPAGDLSFAEPWRGLLSDDLRFLGSEVNRVAPQSVEHARGRLVPDADLDAACRLDGEDGAITDVGGWLMPTTLAGLAGALSLLDA